MADKKISALDAATTPLAGTEVVALVQSGTTKKVPVSDLTAGRAISATQLTLTTGNLIVANGQGIDFSATPGTGTSELLADYEEGTWTPTDASGAGLSFTNVHPKYTRIGRQVTVSVFISYPTTASASAAIIGGLPFASNSAQQSATAIWNDASVGLYGFIDTSTSSITLRNFANTSITNLQLSGRFLCFTFAYTV